MWFDTRPKVNVHVCQTQEDFPCATSESLLAGMVKIGRKGIPVGCVNGGCGVCKVRILEGQTQTLGPISRAHVTHEEESKGYTLACRVAPSTAVKLEVAGKLEKPFRKGLASKAGSSIIAPTTNLKET